ncbi:uncharacterized protein LOC121732672 [Aricia agestis]|uniref:uncharacterized protein LOC121732672 n=1 Tax=Aricia agestis TaxID=91739 RepID=UPI001C20399A|nr:uncharacterized protein LOC121732672 [Aricia agestis]
MSDVIVNDSVPVDKKIGELIKYNIFIMKIVEFVISLLLMFLPFILANPRTFHCLAVAPTLVLSVIFIVLYLVDQVHNLAEQLYLLIQIILNIAAVITIITSEKSTFVLYGLFYCHLLLALCVDQYFVFKERGCVLIKDKQ